MKKPVASIDYKHAKIYKVSILGLWPRNRIHQQKKVGLGIPLLAEIFRAIAKL